MDDNEIARLMGEALDRTIDPPAGSIPAESFARLISMDRTHVPPVRCEPMRDGLPLAVREYAGPPGRTLLLIHGAGGHGEHLHALAAAVAGRGAASVCVPDLRGNGRSAVLRSDAVAYEDQLRDDLLDLLAALRHRHAGTHFVLAGHSAGGGLLLRLFTDRPAEDVRGVALLAPLLGGGPITRPGLGGWVTLYGRRVKALVALNRRGIDGLNGLTAMQFNQPPGTGDGRETLAWSFATMRAFGPADWRRELAAVRVPLAVLIGDTDECFVAEAYPDAVSAVNAAALVTRLPECGHWDLLADPRAADGLARFVQVL